MADTLPDEIWIMILGYVPLGDRLKNLQFVNRRLHILCFHPILVKYLDFSSAILLGNESCKSFIKKIRKSPKSVSFKGCHWFSETLYSELPILPKLESLDLSGCYLKGAVLYQVLQKTPRLEYLAISISGKELKSFFNECLELRRDLPKLCLRTLHIESYPGGISYTDLSTLITRHFFSESNQRPKSLSVDWLTPVKSFAKLYLVPSEFTLDYECDLDLCTSDACRAFCTALLCANMHHPLVVSFDGVPNCLPRYDLSKIKFLSLPNVTSINWQYDSCNSSKCPSVLPNLECLILPVMNYKEGSCYYILKHALLLSCSCPNLKSLKVTGECSSIPLDFYSRISLLKNLEELNLMEIVINVQLLLRSVQELKNLQSLSIFPHENIKHRRRRGGFPPCESTGCPNVVKILPQLMKLEISQSMPNVSSVSASCSSILDQIGGFKKLQKFSLRGVGLPDSFSATLKTCTSITSLCLLQCGRGDVCIYPLLLDGVLSALPNLVELRLQHEMLQFKSRLFEEISECKRIEKVVLSNIPVDGQSFTWYDDHLVSPTFLGHCLKLVVSNCSRLHIFIVQANFSRHWYDRWENCKSTLISPDKRLILECGHPGLVSSGRNPILFKLLDFTKSSIFDYNPFNFPYSNQD